MAEPKYAAQEETATEELSPREQALIARLEALEEAAKTGAVQVADLPPNAFRAPDGSYWHKITTMSEGGSYIEQTRRLSLSLQEAIDNRWDYYHPTMGLIYEGYKLARDRDSASILADTSESMMKPSEMANFAKTVGGA